MKYAFILFLFSIRLAAFGQDYQQEINDQVWKPLMKASSSFDGEGFMAIQSSDLIRIALDKNTIYGLQAYADQVLPGFKRQREAGKVTRTTEVRFTNRITSAEFSYEAGYFKSVVKFTDGNIRVVFTRFCFIMRKEPEGWRILVDSDSNGDDVTEEMFEAATPVK